MTLLSSGMTHGQAVALVLLCVFSLIFIIFDVYLVLFLHRRNKRIAKDAALPPDDESVDGTSTNSDER